MAGSALFQAPVSVDFLRKLSKDLHSYVPADGNVSDESVNRLSDLLTALIETASITHLAASHRAGACNPLCSIVEKCQASSDERVRTLVWTNHVWTDLFDIYLERYDNAKPKSMRQVLLVLCSVLQKDKSQTAQAVRDESISRLFDILFQEDDTSKVKPALGALSYFIQKEVILVGQLITKFELWSAEKGRSLQLYAGPARVAKAFLHGIINWANHQDTTPAAGNAVSVILDYSRRQKVDHLQGGDRTELPIWVEPLESTIRRNPDAMLNFRSHVFPDLFKPVLPDYLRFLEYLHLDDHIRLKPSSKDNLKPADELEASLLFTSLQVGKDMGFVQEVDHRFSCKIEIRDDVVLIPDRLLGRLLAHERPETRLAAFALLTTSAAITRPLTLNTFAALKRNLPHLHADTDANFRGEIMSLTLNLFERLRGATGVMSRTLAKEQQTGSAPTPEQAFSAKALGTSTFELFHAHVEFVQWFLRFITSELHPTAAYQRHISALKSLTIIMKSGLDPSVPFSALSRTAQGEIRFPFHINILTPLLVRELFDLIMDPFDDVRHAAAFLLKLGSPRKDEPTPKQPKIPPVLVGEKIDSQALIENGFASFLDRAERTMLRSGRADHADGVARAYDLLFERRAEPLSPDSPANAVLADWMKSRRGIVEHLISLLDETIAAASKNLSVAVNAYPMHGTLSALRYIVDQPAFYSTMTGMGSEEIEHWKGLHNHILASLRSVWDCVRNVLCVDAPEGHVPEDMEDEPDITTKDILSYSWRGLKEASTLLRVVVAKAPFELPSGASVLNTTEFEGLGKLCFLQLAELRHRGAFSTVAQTFAAFCLRCSRSQSREIKSLLDHWYEETLRCIRDKGSVITRRSAGLPSLMTGILAAAPEGALFERVMSDLKIEAVQEGQDENIEGSNLPQVHALNCLKDVFTNTKLALASEPYVAEGMSLAASRLESKVWAIRNCGLMLFRALVDRLLGSSTTQNWKDTDRLKIARLSYRKYPNLLDIIVQLLNPRRQGNNSDGAHQELTNTALEGVFPAFQILQRARPPAERRAEIQQLVFNLTASAHWHVRDMAARTLAALLGHEERIEWVLALLEMPFVKQNALHGILLSAKYLVKELCEDNEHDIRDDLDVFYFALSEQFERLYKHNVCPLTKSAYLDVVDLVMRHAISDNVSLGPFFGENIYSYLLNDSKSVYGRFHRDQQNANSGRSAGDSLLRRALSLFVVQHWLLEALAHRATPALKESALEHTNRVAIQDLDTCRITLEYLVALTSPLIAHFEDGVHAGIAELLSAAAKTSDLEVSATVRHAFAELLDNGLHLQVSHLVPIMLDTPLAQPNGRPNPGSPSLHEGSLPLLARFIDAQLAADADQQQQQQLVQHLQHLAHTLRRDLKEDNPFPTRSAAIAALAALCNFWRLVPNSSSAPLSSAKLKLALITYDALNDDDDDIRDAAARVGARIVAGPRLAACAPDPPTVVPLAAAAKLAEWLVVAFSGEKRLCVEAVERLLERESGREEGARGALEWVRQGGGEEEGFAGLLKELRKENTALFAREKQNLFVDPVREARLWSSAVLTMVRPEAVPREVARGLEGWVLQGLRVLRETAEREVDGALGWASKGEVFVLGVRVVCAAEVVLAWRRARVRGVTVRGSTVRRTLREVCDVWKESRVHGLWVRKAEGLLTESVVRRLADVRDVLVEGFGERMIC